MKINKENRNSILIALLFCSNALTWILKFNNAIVVLIMSSFLLAILINKNLLLKLNVLFFITIILLCFIFSDIVFSYNPALEKTFLDFLVFGIPSLYLSQLKFNKYFLYKSITIIAILMLPFVLTMNFGNPETDEIDYGHWMGISYGLLKFIIGLLVFFFYVKIKSIRLIILGTFLSYILILLLYGSRGTILSVLLFVLLYYFIANKVRLKSILKFTFIIVLIFISFRFYIEYTNADLFFLNKSEQLSEGNNDISNGRFSLYSDAIAGISDYPLLGQGIAAFENNYNRYPHNFILQILYEGGVVLLIIILHGFFKFFNKSYIVKINKNNLVFICFIMCLSFTELLFSSVFWKSQIFWFLIGYVSFNRYLIDENSNTSL